MALPTKITPWTFGEDLREHSESVWWLPLHEGCYKFPSNGLPMDVWCLIPAQNPNQNGRAEGLQVCWPNNIVEEQAWRFAHRLLRDAPETLGERQRRIRGSGAHLWYNVNGRTQPLNLRDWGDKNGPDNPQVLQSSLVNLEVLNGDVARLGALCARLFKHGHTGDKARFR